jgi:Domain of unknown function (DUF4440)
VQGGRLIAAGVALTLAASAYSQQSRWAANDDPTAKSLIDLERKWAESDCTHSLIEQTMLADDFHGVSHLGQPYSKKDAVEDAKSAKTSATHCVLRAVRVHFFGDSMAILYGSETIVRKDAAGKEQALTLIWTDTWLKRNGMWQVVAAEDLPSTESKAP